MILDRRLRSKAILICFDFPLQNTQFLITPTCTIRDIDLSFALLVFRHDLILFYSYSLLLNILSRFLLLSDLG